MHIATNSNIPKIIAAIVATSVLMVIAFVFLSSYWFWVQFDIVAASLVAIGCCGEWYLHHHPSGRKKREKDEHHKLESRFIAAVSLGVVMEVLALGHTIHEGKKLDEKVAVLTNQTSILVSSNLSLSLSLESFRSNNLVLTKNVDDLIRAYRGVSGLLDEATNALAEANARLASVRPFKDRFVDCLNDIDPNILTDLKAGKTNFVRVVPANLYSRLMVLTGEKGTHETWARISVNPITRYSPNGQEYEIRLRLSPELAK